MINSIFGNYKIISNAENKHGHVRYVCECICGNIKIVNKSDLLRGHSKSCGCLSANLSKSRFTTHGMRQHKIYKVWQNMKNRCSNTNVKDYPYYGARGITVCERWLNSFENFYEDMGDIPFKGAEIDRINNDGNYCKDNCHWITHSKNMRNTRANTILTYNGVSKIMSEWAEYLGVPCRLLAQRKYIGWSDSKIIESGKSRLAK